MATANGNENDTQQPTPPPQSAKLSEQEKTASEEHGVTLTSTSSEECKTEVEPVNTPNEHSTGEQASIYFLFLVLDRFVGSTDVCTLRYTRLSINS